MSAALSFAGVSAAYGARAVLHNVTTAFRGGCVTGLVGPNGAGKTTLLRAALGLLPLSVGAVRVLDRDLGALPREARARAVAYLAQNAEAHWPIAARRLVALGRLPHGAKSAVADTAAIEEAMVRCDALQFAGRRMDTLSAGERARVLLARALAVGAPILLADEPAAHLDPAHQLRLMALLRDEARRGTAVVVTLHDLSLASRHCDEVAVMQGGRLAAQGAPAAVLDDATLAAVFGIDVVRAAAGEGMAIVPWKENGR